MKLLYIILFIALPSALFAQTNYHEGYVLKNNGDTLKGFIDYREWSQSPKSIHFKINKESQSILQFNPNDIQKFQITGLETYLTYSGSISKNSTRFPNLQDALDTGKKAATIFLKQVTTGKYLTLFYYEDDLKPYYFIAETNRQPVELNYYQYYKYGDNQKTVARSDVYKGQLSSYISQYNPTKSNLMTLLEDTQYEQSDLKHLIDEINDNAIANKKTSSARFFAGIVINNTSTRYDQEINQFSPGTAKTTTISPKINLGFDIFNNKNTQRLIFRGELSFSYINPKFTFPLNLNNRNTTAVYSFNQYTATLTPQVLLNIYNKENFKLYVDVGIGLNCSAYPSNKFILENGQSPVDVTNEAAPKLEPIWLNFPFQVGVTLNKKIELALTYFGYDTYTNNTNYDVTNSSVGVGIKYFFSGR